MPPFLTKAWEQIGGLWSKSTLAQRILYLGMLASVIIVFIVLLFLVNRTEYKVLYSNLYPEDAARVVQILEKQKVAYKLQDNGATILVPAGQVYNLRLMIAGEGALQGQGVGFEIFDQNKIGQTDFVQRINYQRALQGELARTISEFPEVEAARVHLVLPNKSLFIEEQNPPSASVVLKLKPGYSLNSQQVQSIVNLITTGVEGMEPERITVSDTRGKILYQHKPDSLEGLTNTQLEYQLNFQQNLEKRIEQMLAPIVGGPNRVIAKVNVDLDFSQKTIHKEIYDPEGAVIRSEQKTDESSRGVANLEQGVPEPAYQGEGVSGSGSTQETSRTTSTTNYEISKEEQQIVAPIGEVRRLSVAVIVDGKYTQDKNGEFVYQPLTEQELARIRQLVENAVGFDQARGDSIEVSNLSFGPPEPEIEPTLLEKVSEYFQIIGKPLLNALIILLFLILVVRPVVMAILKPKVVEEEAEDMEGLPEGEEKMALVEGLSEEEQLAMEEQKRIEDTRALATQLASENFDQAFAVIKKWLKEEEGA